MVIAPASTGNDNKSKTAVTQTPQAKSGILYIAMPVAFMFIIVLIKLIAPSKEEAPAKCKENIPISTAGPEWAAMALKGG